MIQFSCECGARYDVDDELADRAIRCRECNEWGRVLPRKASRHYPVARRSAQEDAEWYYRLSGMKVLCRTLAGLTAILGLVLVVLFITMDYSVKEERVRAAE